MTATDSLFRVRIDGQDTHSGPMTLQEALDLLHKYDTEYGDHDNSVDTYIEELTWRELAYDQAVHRLAQQQAQEVPHK